MLESFFMANCHFYKETYLRLSLCFAFWVGLFFACPMPAWAQSEGSALPFGGDVLSRVPGMQLLKSDDDTEQQDGGASAGPTQATQQAVETQIRAQAFNAALTGLLPLHPNEIRAFLKRYDQVREAIEKPVYPYPEPEIVFQTISLDPGSTPPLIKLATNHVSTLNILDVTGAPWAIQDVSWAGNFEITQPEEGAHVIRIIPLSEFSHGNISIRLVELKTPIIFTLETHRDTVQYRFDARIPQPGPEAKVPLMEGTTKLTAGDSTLNAILDGVPPSDVEKLNVTGVDGRTTAYRLGDMTFVRTPLTLLSPGWFNSLSSADGMHVYALTNAPVLLLSHQGQVTRAFVSSQTAKDSEMSGIMVE